MIIKNIRKISPGIRDCNLTDPPEPSTKDRRERKIGKRTPNTDCLYFDWSHRKSTGT